MPRIRRSNRIQSKNSKQKSDNSKNEPSINSTVVEVETESETEQETQKCFACKQRHPPIRRYTLPPLYRSIHCIDLFLDSYDILSMHTLPDVYIINEVKGYFLFRFC